MLVVHPGGIKTSIAFNAPASAKALGLQVTDSDQKRRKLYEEKLLKTDPAQAAEIVVKGVTAGKSACSSATTRKRSTCSSGRLRRSARAGSVAFDCRTSR